MEKLPCSAIVYRAMRRKEWAKGGSDSILPAAFIRRADEIGLSVDIKSPRSCCKNLRKCHGVVSLHVGRVRDLRLDIVVDESPHANITGLPRQEDNRTEAEYLASRLARQVRIVPLDQYRDSA